jgi:hypothetical protein
MGDYIVESMMHSILGDYSLTHILSSEEGYNPYLSEFLEVGGNMYITDLLNNIKSSIPWEDPRFKMIGKYAFAVPCRAALEEISKYSPLIEIGAGTGYWAYLLKQMGVDILPVDCLEEKENWKHIFELDIKYTNIIEGDENTILQYPERNLFLCWPPYNDPMAANCLRNFKGEYVVYVGEHGGCTGDQLFEDMLEVHYEIITTIDIPKWEGVHDAVFIYRRLKYDKRGEIE